MLLVALATMYRVPLLVADLYQRRALIPVGVEFRMIVKRNLQACAMELWLVLQILVLFVLVAGTLVRMPEALEAAVTEKHSLLSMRNMLKQMLLEACGAICELLSVLTAVKTYRLVFKAILQCCLVPPACLSEFIGRLCCCLPLLLRFALSFLLFYSLALAPFVSNWLEPQLNKFLGDHWTVKRFFLCVLGSCLVCNFFSVFTKKSFCALPVEDWAPP